MSICIIVFQVKVFWAKKAHKNNCICSRKMLHLACLLLCLVLYADFIGLLNTEPLLSSGGFSRLGLDCLSGRY